MKNSSKRENFDIELYLKSTFTLFEHAYNIARSYRSDLKREEKVERIENVKNYDPSLIRKSLKDSRLFIYDEGKIKPQKLYTYAYEVNFDTYENRFVVSLTKKVLHELNNLVALLDTKLELPFLSSGFSFSEFGTYPLFERYLKKENKSGFSLNEACKRLFIYGQRLLSTELFKRTSSFNLQNVEATNLLLQDKDYSYCYNYYINQNELEKERYESIIAKLKKEIKEKYDVTTSYVFSLNDVKFHFHFDANLIKLNLTYKKVELTYNAEVAFDLVFPKLVFTGADEFIVSLYDVKNYLAIFLSLATIFDKAKEICPICHNELIDEKCPSCSAHYKLIKDKLWLINLPGVALKERS